MPMKKTLAALVIAASAMTLFPADAGAWTCGARSRTGGWGVGWAPSLWRAKRIALSNCAVHTPRGYYCRITSCRR
jgi:hypothetical protein